MRPGPESEVGRRLVLLTNEYPFDRGDATFVQNEIDELAASFDEVVVFNSPSPGEHTMRRLPDGVRYGGSLKEADRSMRWRVLLNPRRAARYVRILFDEFRHGRVGRKVVPVLLGALAAVSRAAHPDLRRALRGAEKVSVYSFWAMGAGMAVPALDRVDGVVAVRLHRYDLYEDVLGWLPLRGSILTRPDLLLPISTDGAEYLESHYPWSDRARVVVSRLGTHDRGEGAGRSSDGVITVVSCSALTPVKRVDVIARAVAVLSRTGSVRWIHFGDGPLREELRALADELASEDLAIDLRGQTANDEIMEFYQTQPVDVFVNVSASEGVPVSIMEAMSFGIPVVATRVGGVAEIVDLERGSGRTIPPEAGVEAIADALREVAHDGALDPRAAWQERSDARVNTGMLVKDLLA